jgi:hypothetical protein
LEKLIKGLFFNIILSIKMEGFFEFIGYSLLNFYNMDLTLNVEILGILFSAFYIFLAAIFLPIAYK